MSYSNINSYSFFPSSPTSPNAFNLFIPSSQSPRDTHAAYQDLRQVLRPSNQNQSTTTKRSSSGSSVSSVKSGLKSCVTPPATAQSSQPAHWAPSALWKTPWFSPRRSRFPYGGKKHQALRLLLAWTGSFMAACRHQSIFATTEQGDAGYEAGLEAVEKVVEFGHPDTYHYYHTLDLFANFIVALESLDM
ncbi:hypothetical protein FPV67DRAFT_1664777 [Lyophyllum atratum]|nr:hypothetical protein FPV67DRAFT_1664777 [Lyophyllum atratum]